VLLRCYPFSEGLVKILRDKSDAETLPGKNKIAQSKVVYSINRLILVVILLF
jgi:hypothetical protein